MASSKLFEEFTVDEEINHWVAGDNTVELCGYVDNIEGTKNVPSSCGSSSTTPLFKIIVNNGANSRVRVLFWGKLATDYSAKICDRSVIKITRAKTCEVNRRFSNPNDVVGPYELSVNSATVVEMKSEKYEEATDEAPILTVQLRDAVDSKKTMYVIGWLKLPFAPVTSYGSTHGSGVLVDGEHKLRVQIANYQPNPNLVQESYVKIRCDCAADCHGVPFLMVRSSSDIVVETSQNSMSAVELKKVGFVTPKRKADGELSGDQKRFAPFG